MPRTEPLAPRAAVALAPLSTLGVGGAARWYVRATTIEEARTAIAWANDARQPILVLGGGSNLVVADQGWPGLALHVGIEGIELAPDGSDTLATAGAGEAWDGFVARLVGAGLAGVECLSGIPGTVGGTPVQNVGAYGQEVADVIDHVTLLDRASGVVTTWTNAQCQFGYRTSRLRQGDANRFIVCRVAFRVRPGRATVKYPDVIAYLEQHAMMSPRLSDVREAVLAIRRRKGMVLDPSDPDTRSVGSFFVNPAVPAETFNVLRAAAGGEVPSFAAGDGRVKIPAAWLIENAGFAKGFSLGRVGISTKHPLALVNRGSATAREVVALAVRIKRAVADRFGIALRTEPIFVGFAADPDVAYLQEAQG